MIDLVEPGGPDKAKNLLSQSPVTELRELQVSNDGQSLFISGRVSSFYHKQLAQETVRQVATGLHVVNRVNVD